MRSFRSVILSGLFFGVFFGSAVGSAGDQRRRSSQPYRSTVPYVTEHSYSSTGERLSPGLPTAAEFYKRYGFSPTTKQDWNAWRSNQNQRDYQRDRMSGASMGYPLWVPKYESPYRKR